MIIIWLGALIVFVVVEAATYALTSIWFAAGALVALFAAALGATLWLQITLFIAVTAVALASTRTLAQKLMKRGKTHTNADAALDHIGIVTETIDNIAGSGRVSMQNRQWAARSLDGGTIPVGAEVRAERIEGVKLIVYPARSEVTL